MTPTHVRLPPGFEVRIRDDVRRLDDGRLLVGGSPLRAIRLSDRARALISDATVLVEDEISGRLATRLLAANVALPVLGDPCPADRVTVVIPVRDRPDQLDRALAALGGSLRCVVVDDASLAPASVAEVAHEHGAEVVTLSENVGPAGARNAGLRVVRTPYVAFVDSDVTVAAVTLLGLARHFADPGVAVVGPLVAGRVRSSRPRWFERYDERAGSLALGDTAGSVRPGSAVGWLPSACLVARVTALGDGFDAGLRVGEDVDLVWRMVDAGQTVRYDPSEVAHHDVRPTFRGWLGRKFVYGTGGATLASRHGDKGAPAVLSPEMALGAVAVLSRRWWSAPVAALVVGRGIRSLTRTLPESPERSRLAVALSARGLGWAVRQESALLLRHWWPATVALSLVSSRTRRLVGSALLVDLALGVADHPRAHPVVTIAGRRLDDLAYGAGLWSGCVRLWSFAALRIRWVRADRPSGSPRAPSPRSSPGCRAWL